MLALQGSGFDWQGFIGSGFAVCILAFIASAHWAMARSDGSKAIDAELGMSIAVSNKHTNATEQTRQTAHQTAKPYYNVLAFIFGGAALVGVVFLVSGRSTYAGVCCVAAFLLSVPVYVTASIKATAAAKNVKED